MRTKKQDNRYQIPWNAGPRPFRNIFDISSVGQALGLGYTTVNNLPPVGPNIDPAIMGEINMINREMIGRDDDPLDIKLGRLSNQARIGLGGPMGRVMELGDKVDILEEEKKYFQGNINNLEKEKENIIDRINSGEFTRDSLMYHYYDNLGNKMSKGLDVEYSIYLLKPYKIDGKIAVAINQNNYNLLSNKELTDLVFRNNIYHAIEDEINSSQHNYRVLNVEDGVLTITSTSTVAGLMFYTKDNKLISYIIKLYNQDEINVSQLVNDATKNKISLMVSESLNK
jgi:hypothetical protein